jgi:hypothetical protein
VLPTILESSSFFGKRRYEMKPCSHGRPSDVNQVGLLVCHSTTEVSKMN